MRYGNPITAARNIKNGFFEGVGWPFGRREGPDGESPWNDAKAEGVSDVASAGGARPVTLAKSVRSQRRTVKIPRMDPSVVRSVENCSATCTIAVSSPLSANIPLQPEGVGPGWLPNKIIRVERTNQRNSNA